MKIKVHRLPFMNACVGLCSGYNNIAYAIRKTYMDDTYDNYVVIDRYYVKNHPIEFTMVVVLHEIAHLILKHTQPRNLEHEIIADAFAAEVLGDPLLVTNTLKSISDKYDDEYFPRITSLHLNNITFRQEHISKMRGKLSEIADVITRLS
ncbi:hypothetical protein KAR91_66400 [Candidatus Pacearchaeota archaeon]|nr:hypothetical protein [Candidatus Pacearchaeota archaeon]